MKWSQFGFAMSAIFVAPHMTSWLAVLFAAFYAGIALFSLRDEAKHD